ncbi:MAG: SDR family NAD(P)-dependent oxidoreductase [Gammaproteobacteria bacterium]|nr:SDR family NAD(P)-dependent oxidoreductase [Gammaproteobacteria bacterium]
MQRTAVVIGASRGIGAAVVELLANSDRYQSIHAVARTVGASAHAAVATHRVDAGDEAQLRELASRIEGPIDLLLHCVGALDVGPRTPEKSLADLDPALLIAAYTRNVVPAALVLKHFATHLRRSSEAVAIVLSAKVGSIGDNRLGGWYGYRAAKAALNQIIHTAAIELGRGGGPRVLAVHPGTTYTQLSNRYVAKRAGVAPASVTAQRLLRLAAEATPQQSGSFVNWDGTPLPW